MSLLTIDVTQQLPFESLITGNMPFERTEDHHFTVTTHASQEVKIFHTVIFEAEPSIFCSLNCGINGGTYSSISWVLSSDTSSKQPSSTASPFSKPLQGERQCS